MVGKRRSVRQTQQIAQILENLWQRILIEASGLTSKHNNSKVSSGVKSVVISNHKVCSSLTGFL